MKKWIAIVLAVLVVLLGAAAWIGSYFLPVYAADCVVRVSFTGLSNIFHEYYAVLGDRAVRVADWVVEDICPEAISGDKYKDTKTTQWITSLIYVPRAEMFDGEQFLYRNYPWLPTDFGEQYRVYYHNRGGPKNDAGPEVQTAMEQAARYFHDGDINNWSSMSNGTGDRELTWFIFVSDGNNLLVQLKEDALYLPNGDGTFQLLMECPAEGQFDYFWFP